MKVNRISLVLLVLLSASLCVAQSDKKKADSKAKPDLSGTWILDPANSKVDREISYYVLTIIHREPDITLIKKYKRGKRQVVEKFVYHTDGKSEVDPSIRPTDPSPVTRWQGDKLVRRSVRRPVNGSLTFHIETIEEWMLSQDKQTLVRTTTMWMETALVAKAKATFRRSP